MASFQDRANAAWGDVQNPVGKHYVPDPTSTMDEITLEINVKRINTALDYWNVQPVPHDYLDLYNKEVSGKGSSISTVVKQIVQFLNDKKEKYTQILSAMGVTMPGATATDSANQNSVTNGTLAAGVNLGAAANNSKNLPTTPVPTTSVTVAKSTQKTWLIVGGIIAAVATVAIVVIRHRHKGKA